MPTVNIGILAHVDAGKTSLTERLLFETGVIGRLGSVDAGTTQTDRGEIERRRGITIKSAVAAFAVGDLRVNLIDTPGHSDFVAEVERALGVLDGAVLVLSAVEGVQAHTRRLMKTLRRLRVPTLLFVNKVDRVGARHEELLADVRRLLTPDAVAVTAVTAVEGVGTKAARVYTAGFAGADAERLADHDDAILAALVDDRVPGEAELRAALARQTALGNAYPVYFGSAITGVGVAELVGGVRDLLPRAGGDADGETRGTVFAIERGRAGEKTAYVRLRDGVLRTRDRTAFGTVTALDVVGVPGAAEARPGDIAKVRGLAGIRVGDRFGSGAGAEDDEAAATAATAADFASPSLETVVRAADGDRTRLHAALVEMADQDPLIRTRALPGGESSVLLYGEVQKEVVAATLAEEYGVEALFAPSRTVYTERPSGVGEYSEDMNHDPSTRLRATLGFRVAPGAAASGRVFRYETELGALPPVYHRATEETVLRSLEQGLDGWEVTDVVVTMVHSGFCSVTSVAGDFRKLAPFVLMRALTAAGTEVFEPCHAFELDVPADTVSAVLSALIAAEAEIEVSEGGTAAWSLRGNLPARTVRDVEKTLPALTRGEAVWLSQAAGDRPVRSRPAPRERTDGNPAELEQYLRYLALEKA
ncbi:small GTP-binding protein [Catenulispora acidiphila DSM 44928]|uniref:Small GTP-binding protein n=1 Tax=Catenulispora acidiphila (strain DSM 44928 / JCM 14897 / NBRC 102108 / NRRL B-24433 / ID139908) TaxID=479433 RepID=C7QIZ3_CATAD|nr:GTP-binding protein [Catenulispora acidiphila]ACU77043.1 small GTP-binding protein [Catenulispora acidiphila DSM 44928]